MSRSCRSLMINALVLVLLILHSANAYAATVVITNVIPDATQTTVYIYGQNFCTSPAPQVFMFIPPNVATAQTLTVTSFTSSQITATLPAAQAGGAYLFFVNCGGVFTGYVAVLDPDMPGPIGATGSTGATGATGATGVVGATGATGSAANVLVRAPLNSTGGATPLLGLPGVQIEQLYGGNTATGYM